MKVLIIGYGSIGERHARILDSHGHEVACVTRNPKCSFTTYIDVAKGITEFQPELIIISNRTIDHFDTMNEVAATGFSKRILIEKPIFNSVPPTLSRTTDNVFTAYNLRFHPMVQRTADLLQGKTIHSARFHVGQYLPDWRPGTDYTTCYSAHKSQGGGVLRDLSHELDLALWLMGPWQRVTALGGHFSSLQIDSDDVFSMLLECDRCHAVSIHMDYLNRVPRRGFEINAEELSIHADFISGHLEINADRETYRPERDVTYEAQIQAMTSDNVSNQCTFEEGLAVLKLIEAAEKSATEKTWIKAS